MCHWPLDTSLPVSQRPLSLLVSRVFKARPIQVALSHAPEGLYPSFSLGDSVVNQVTVCSGLEPTACRSSPCLMADRQWLPLLHMAPPDFSYILLVVPGCLLCCPSPSLESFHAITACGSFLGFLCKADINVTYTTLGASETDFSCDPGVAHVHLGVSQCCGKDYRLNASLPGFSFCLCHSLTVWQGPQPFCESLTYL